MSMTENEAIKELKYIKERCDDEGRYKDCDALEKAIQALSEIQECRAIGTVEEFKALKEKGEPKKIKEVHLDEYYCPACGSENNCSNHTVEHKYCPSCGQALEI